MTDQEKLLDLERMLRELDEFIFRNSWPLFCRDHLREARDALMEEVNDLYDHITEEPR